MCVRVVSMGLITTIALACAYGSYGAYNHYVFLCLVSRFICHCQTDTHHQCLHSRAKEGCVMRHVKASIRSGDEQNPVQESEREQDFVDF